jgi:hypothetical protein
MEHLMNRQAFELVTGVELPLMSTPIVKTDDAANGGDETNVRDETNKDGALRRLMMEFLLPLEDCAAFAKLHDRLIAELKPRGVLQEDAVWMIAVAMWRKNYQFSFWQIEKRRAGHGQGAKPHDLDPLREILRGFGLKRNPESEGKEPQQANEEQEKPAKIETVVDDDAQHKEMSDGLTLEALLEHQARVDHFAQVIADAHDRLTQLKTAELETDPRRSFGSFVRPHSRRSRSLAKRMSAHGAFRKRA